MKYKLLAIDLDDTLLNDDLKISEKNIQAINKAREIGVKVVIATGRPLASAKPYYDLLKLDSPIIVYQGAIISDIKTNITMYSQEIGLEHGLEIIRFAEQKGIHCNIYLDDIIYIEKINKWAELYHSFMPNMQMEGVGKLSNFLKRPTTKIIYVDDHDYLNKIAEEAKQVAGKDINVFMSKPNYLEFTNKHASKGKALEVLADYYKISRKEVIAIGDTYNDLTMLQYAGKSICMGNGPEEVKKAADYITLSNNKDGVAHAIEQFIL